MNYSVHEKGTFAIVELAGDIDLSCSPDARSTILGCLNQSKNVLVDLSGVTYIDSSGIASLVEGYQTAKKGNLRFGLVGVSDPALSVLQLARLDRVFSIYATVDEGVEADT